MSAPADRDEMAYRRVLEDGREIGVYGQFYNAKLFIGGADAGGMDDAW